MSTTSNFRADAAALLLLTAIGCASGGAGTPRTASSAATVAPDAPLPALEQPPARPEAKRPAGTIELTSVRVRAIDAELARFAGPQFMRESRNPVAIEATTARELPPPLGSSSPVLVVNGTVYPDTWFFKPNRLVVFVPDRALLRDDNVAEAVWLGAEKGTRPREPVRFKRGD